MKEKVKPKYEVLQCVQLRGRYEPSAEIKRGLITDVSWCESGIAGLSGWIYSIDWVGQKEGNAMFEWDIEPAKLVLV